MTDAERKAMLAAARAKGALAVACLARIEELAALSEGGSGVALPREAEVARREREVAARAAERLAEELRAVAEAIGDAREDATPEDAGFYDASAEWARSASLALLDAGVPLEDAAWAILAGGDLGSVASDAERAASRLARERERVAPAPEVRLAVAAFGLATSALRAFRAAEDADAAALAERALEQAKARLAGAAFACAAAAFRATEAFIELGEMSGKLPLHPAASFEAGYLPLALEVGRVARDLTWVRKSHATFERLRAAVRAALAAQLLGDCGEEAL